MFRRFRGRAGESHRPQIAILVDARRPRGWL